MYYHRLLFFHLIKQMCGSVLNQTALAMLGPAPSATDNGRQGCTRTFQHSWQGYACVKSLAWLRKFLAISVPELHKPKAAGAWGGSMDAL